MLNKIFIILILINFHLQANDFTNYTVVKGDTLSKISKAHLSDPRKWRELLNYNKIESPNSIKPGLTLKIPDSLSKKTKPIEKKVIVARVLSKIGQLKLKKNETEDWFDIDINKELITNDIVRTSENSTAEIDFFDSPKTIILMREKSIMKIKLEDVKGIELNLGEVFIKTDNKESEKVKFKLKTNGAVAEVKGTEFEVTSDSNGSKYGCYEGNIDVSAENETVHVPAGFGTIVIKGQPPMKPFKLLEKVKIKPLLRDEK